MHWILNIPMTRMQEWAETMLLILEHLGYKFDNTSIMIGFQVSYEWANAQLIFGAQRLKSS